MDPESIIAVTAEIFSEAGVNEKPEKVTSVSGGANNRVFKVESKGGSFLLKCYFRHPNDPRNRCKSDFEFTRFAWNCGVRAVPEPVGVSWEHHAALYEFVDGLRIVTGTINPTILDQAADMFAAINRNRSSENAAQLQPASESCFSIREHLDCVQRRVNRLQAIDNAQPLGDQASMLVGERLVPEWERISRRLAASEPGETLERSLEAAERCLSPSDFGFHNALMQPDGRMRFFDFEYAGWDDPAKMICDFFCQPEVPVPGNAFDQFTVRALEPFSSPEIIHHRVHALLPVYRIKWCCIILNDFLRTDATRRLFALSADSLTDRKKRQLVKVEKMLLNIAH